MIERVAEALRKAGLRAKLYWKTGGGYDWDVLTVRCSFFDRRAVWAAVEPFEAEETVFFKYSYTLMPWEARSK